MEIMLAILTVVLLAIIPWMVWPVYRTVETQQVGHVLEKLVLGFWIPVRNLSDRKNQLDHEKDKLSKKLKRVIKDLEDEEKHLKSRVQLVNKEYANHLYDWAGKRHWKYLGGKCRFPTFAFVKEQAKEEHKSKKKGRATYFTLENAPLPPDWVMEKDKGRLVKHFVFRDNDRNQQQQNQQKKKGGTQNPNNQQQQNNQQQ